MHLRRTEALAIAIAATLAGSACVHAQAEVSSNMLTIYSAARPGAIPPSSIAMAARARTCRATRSCATSGPSPWSAPAIPCASPTSRRSSTRRPSLSNRSPIPRGTHVVEQNFQFDLVNTAKLLQKYVDRNITVDQVRGNGVESFTGTLLSTSGGLVLRHPDGTIQTVPNNAGRQAARASGRAHHAPDPGLGHRRRASRRRTKPRVSYQTTGITWWADYNVTYAEGASANACRLDVGAWVSILNQSGAGYPDAKLKLVAGDVHRAPPPGRARGAMDEARAMAAESKVAGFEEKAFLRVSPLYARARDQHSRQFDQADRALPRRARRAVRENARLLRAHAGLLRLEPDDRPQLRHPEQQESRRLSRLQELAGQQHGHAAARRAASASPSSTTPTRRSNSSARTRSTTRRKTRKC